MSQIMDQLASEENADLDSEDTTDVSTSNVRPSVSPAEASRTALPPSAFTDTEDAPRPLLLFQYNNACGLGNISMAADSPRIASTNNPPSPEPSLHQPSRPNTLRHQSDFPEVMPEDHDLIYYGHTGTSIQYSAPDFNFLDDYDFNIESNLILDRFLELHPE